MGTTRLAPSPTGAMHLGNARTFLVNWLVARQRGWRVILRIEDLDGPRVKKNADQQLIEDLTWLGLRWDQGPIYQSWRAQLYQDAIAKLLKDGLAYPCVCSRSEAQTAASAPHPDDGSPVYPGTCRGKFPSIQEAQQCSGKAPVLRFAVPDQRISFVDEFRGLLHFDVAQQLGDFVIAKADGTPAYQLAVVVDDAAMGVTHVVRADDLLDSTPRQILLYKALGMAQAIPTHIHLPLVVGQDGKRLAKRHGDTRLAYYRELGVPPQRVLALLARWCGIADKQFDAAGDMVNNFDLQAMPRQTIVFSSAEDAWLRQVK
jgi:glutamyl-tRNA synthetase